MAYGLRGLGDLCPSGFQMVSTSGQAGCVPVPAQGGSSASVNCGCGLSVPAGATCPTMRADCGVPTPVVGPSGSAFTMGQSFNCNPILGESCWLGFPTWLWLVGAAGVGLLAFGGKH